MIRTRQSRHERPGPLKCEAAEFGMCMEGIRESYQFICFTDCGKETALFVASARTTHNPPVHSQSALHKSVRLYLLLFGTSRSLAIPTKCRYVNAPNPCPSNPSIDCLNYFRTHNLNAQAPLSPNPNPNPVPHIAHPCG